MSASTLKSCFPALFTLNNVVDCEFLFPNNQLNLFEKSIFLLANNLEAPPKICALPAKMPPHIKPSASPLLNPCNAPSQPPVIPPTTAPMPALTAILIPTAFADANNAPPAANKPAVPIPAVKNVTAAPATTNAAPNASFTQLS